MARSTSQLELNSTYFGKVVLDGLAQKAVWHEEISQYWERGRPRPHSVRSTLNVKVPDAVTVSRFALIAGETRSQY